MNMEVSVAAWSPETSDVIRNDRGLLRHFNLSDSQTAKLLGRSRQTLINQLGPKNGAKVRKTPYFKLRDIHILVSSALELGRSIDMTAVRKYVELTRSQGNGNDEPQEIHDLVDRLLGFESKGLDYSEGDTLALILPAFAELRQRRSDITDNLRAKVERLLSSKRPPFICVVGTTDLQARGAARWLGLDPELSFGHPLADHHMPTIMVYNPNADEPSSYVLTAKGFELTLPFIGHRVTDCLRLILPESAAERLLPAKKAGEEGATGG